MHASIAVRPCSMCLLVPMAIDTSRAAITMSQNTSRRSFLARSMEVRLQVKAKPELSMTVTPSMISCDPSSEPIRNTILPEDDFGNVMVPVAAHVHQLGR